jgi:chromosome segregation ATPase
VRRLRTDLQSTKKDLQRTHTELAAIQSEVNCFSIALTGVKQDLEREGRTCKTLEAEVKELRGEPQTSTRGLTGLQCGRGEDCNAMSQQNLEEEASCGQTDCRKMKKQAMAKRTADKEAGNGQETGLQKTPSRFCCRRRTHTTLWSSPLATLHSCEATS